MMSLQDSYVYEVGIEWTGRRTGKLSAEGLPAMTISSPPEFSGEPGLWTPEHLLAGATASCMMASFIAIAEYSKLQVVSFKMNVAAKLEKVPGEGYRFTEITLAPEIGVAAEDVEKAQKVLAKAERGCFVSNALRAAVKVEARFVPASPELAR